MLVKLALATLAFPAMSAGSQPSAQTSPTQAEQRQTFDASVAAKLLLQLTQGLEDGNQKQVLAVFDFPHMNNGARFQQHLISFLRHAESIRIHLNLVNASSEGGKGSAEADLEMEVEPRDGGLPVHKQARLNFSVQNSPAGGWKIVDVQPREFFSADAGE